MAERLPDDALRAIYRSAAETRRTLARWRRSESRLLWPMVAYLVVLIVGSLILSFVLFTVVQSSTGATFATISFLVLFDYVLPIVAAVLLFLYLRNRSHRLDLTWVKMAQPPPTLPPNLIEASLVELDGTDREIKSIHRRIWWAVFVACWFSLALGEFSGAVLGQTYETVARTTLSVSASFLVTYGVGLGIAGVLIAWNALYWRRTESRLKQLQADTASRRAAVASFEQTLWDRV